LQPLDVVEAAINGDQLLAQHREVFTHLRRALEVPRRIQARVLQPWRFPSHLTAIRSR
jgi:hypothetical protein